MLFILALLFVFFLLTFQRQVEGVNYHSQGSSKYGPCYRECNKGPMVCEYEFNITRETTMNMYCSNCPFTPADCLKDGCIPGGGNVRTVNVVNNGIPGPPIIVCENDTIIVKVRNMLNTETISIHWHGIHQVGSFFMDGLPQISQYPILPTDMFTYNFQASPAGTHMWHSHSSFQESDGLFGVLIVRRTEPEFISSLYDFDLPEHVVTAWHWYDRPTGEILVSTLHRNDSVKGYGLLINGKGGLKNFYENGNVITTPKEQFSIEKGFRYRFRLIHNSAIYCPLQISVDEHKLNVIASETSFFEPITVDSFMVGAGDRFDFILEADQEKDCYMMRFRGIGDCGKEKTSIHEEAFICYDGLSLSASNKTLTSTYAAADRSGTLFNPSEVATYNYTDKNLIHLTELNCTESEPQNYAGTPNIILYVQIYSRNFETARFPGAWHQFDNVSFLYPGVTFLKNKFQSAYICTEETRDNYCDEDFCRCTYVRKIPKDALVELVFVDITRDRNQDHPVHLHGYKFYIVAMGAIGTNITIEEIKRLNENDLIIKDMINPISKDTVSIPNKGYAIVRFIANNPGFWLLHCHVTNHMELGMAMVLQVGTPDEILGMCHTFKQCGHWYNSRGSIQSSNHYAPAALYLILFIFVKFWS